MYKFLSVGIIITLLLSGCSSEAKIDTVKVDFEEAPVLKIKNCTTYDEGVYRTIKREVPLLKLSNFALRKEDELYGVLEGTLVNLKLNDRKIIYLGVPDEGSIANLGDSSYSIYSPYIPTHLKDAIVVNDKTEDINSNNEKDEYTIDIDLPTAIDKNKVIVIENTSKTISKWEELGETFAYFGKGIPDEKLHEYALYQEYLKEKEKLKSDHYKEELYSEEYDSDNTSDNNVDNKNNEIVIIGG